MIKKVVGKLKSIGALLSDDLDDLVTFAERLMSAEKFSRAITVWKVILKRFPERAPDGVYIRLARCYININKLECAWETLDKLKRRNPPHIPRHLFEMKLEVLTLKKQWEDILEVCDEIDNYEKPEDIPSAINQARSLRSISQRIIDISEYKKTIKTYRTSSASIKNKIAIYTAIAGGYDTLKLPAKLDPRFDFIVFCDNPVPNTGVYAVRPLPYIDNDPTRSARYVKTHPHTLLPEYETAVWIDANIMIADDFSDMLDKFLKSNKYFGAIPHPHRNNIYEEAEECIKRSKDDSGLINRQIDHYKSKEIVGDQLIESNLLMFKLDNPELGKLLHLWWQEIDTYSRRDQLSLPYALEVFDVDWHQLTQKPYSIRDNQSFLLTPHNLNPLANNILNSMVSDQFTIEPTTLNDTPKEVSTFTGSVDVVVCVHNALDDVKLCLESVEKYKPDNNFRLIIINDGSADETKNYLIDFSRGKDWVVLTHKSTGSGYSKAANRGLKLSTADVVFLLNSDTIVTSNWINKMTDALMNSPNPGLVGPLSSAASHQSIPDHLSTKDQTAVNGLPKDYTPEDMNKFCEASAASDMQPLVPLVHGFCQGISRNVIDKIGYFDVENFPRGYGEENDYCFRATNAGFNMVIATNTYIFHSKSKSYVGPERVTLMKQGSAKLKELHGEERIKRSIRTMQSNPLLIKIRKEAEKLYR